MNILNRYIIKPESRFVFGQDARTKEWYCKELPTQDMKEADALIGEANRICNKYNKQNEGGRNKKPPTTPQKGKGLD